MLRALVPSMVSEIGGNCSKIISGLLIKLSNSQYANDSSSLNISSGIATALRLSDSKTSKYSSSTSKVAKKAQIHYSMHVIVSNIFDLEKSESVEYSVTCTVSFISFASFSFFSSKRSVTGIFSISASLNISSRCIPLRPLI